MKLPFGKLSRDNYYKYMLYTFYLGIGLKEKVKYDFDDLDSKRLDQIPFGCICMNYSKHCSFWKIKRTSLYTLGRCYLSLKNNKYILPNNTCPFDKLEFILNESSK